MTEAMNPRIPQASFGLLASIFYQISIDAKLRMSDYTTLIEPMRAAAFRTTQHNLAPTEPNLCETFAQSFGLQSLYP
jgi:hypothetical protein